MDKKKLNERQINELTTRQKALKKGYKQGYSSDTYPSNFGFSDTSMKKPQNIGVVSGFKKRKVTTNTKLDRDNEIAKKYGEKNAFKLRNRRPKYDSRVGPVGDLPESEDIEMTNEMLDRLCRLAGINPSVDKSGDSSHRDIRLIMENLKQTEESYCDPDDELDESKALDRARYDADSTDKKKVSLPKAPWDKKDDKKSKDLDESEYSDRPGERSVAPTPSGKPDGKNDLASIKQRAIIDVRSSSLNQDMVHNYTTTIRGAQNGEQLYDVIFDLAKQGVLVDGKKKSADWHFLLEPDTMNETEEEVEWEVTMPIENPDVVGRKIVRLANERGIDYEDIGWDAEGNFSAICASRSDASRFTSLLRNRFMHPIKNQMPKMKQIQPEFDDAELAKQDREEKITLKPGEGDTPKFPMPKLESEQMREWANSIGQNYEDRGQVLEQPPGETVDLSLRRYLNAQPHTVRVQEDIVVENLVNEYKQFVKSKTVKETWTKDNKTGNELNQSKPFDSKADAVAFAKKNGLGARSVKSRPAGYVVEK